MKKILLMFLAVNPLFLNAGTGDPCDGPAGCPIYEHIKDEGDNLLKEFLPAAVVVLLITSSAGAVTSGADSDLLNIDKNTYLPGIQMMPIESKFEINTFTLDQSMFNKDFDLNKTSFNLLEVKYKFN